VGSSTSHSLADWIVKARSGRAPSFRTQKDRWWHEATDAEKKPFLAKAEVERARYAKEAAKYKKVADAKAPPKRPMSAYMQFAKERGAVLRSKHPSWGIGEVGKKLGAEWANVTDAQKKKYELLASKDAMRYAKEKVIYERKFGEIPVKKRRVGAAFVGCRTDMVEEPLPGRRAPVEIRDPPMPGGLGVVVGSDADHAAD
jgi:hypothetical protein